MPIVANLISLEDLGGLQTLYEAWLLARADEGLSVPLTIHRARSEPNARFMSSIALAGGHVLLPLSEHRRASGVFEASLQFISRMREKDPVSKILRQEGVRNLVLWNNLPKASLRKSARHLTFYDHGASWIFDSEAKNRKRLNLADTFISVSRASAAMLEQRWGLSKPINVLPNPLRFLKRPKRSRSADQEICVIGAAGRLVSFKGFASLINAAPFLRRSGLRFKILIAGDGIEKANMEALIRRLNAEAEVELIGPVSDMVEFYNRLDMFVCPSLREPFGLVALEAMACGLPTILADVDGLRETVPPISGAELLTPEVSVSDYIASGGSADRMPKIVYHPASGLIGPPLALDPRRLASKIETIWAELPSYLERAAAGAEEIVKTKTMQSYDQSLSSILQQI